jgi:hypothetical protein
MMGARWAIIWQPLQTPSAKVSPRWKKAVNCFAQPLVEQHRLGPALAGAEHVAVGEAAAGRDALEISQMHAPGLQVGHMHIVGREAGALEGGGHFDWPLTPCSRRIAIFGRAPVAMNGRRGEAE